MSKENISAINVGIFGHIDHGKTTLLQKLSGRWADTHSEELKRGITIKIGYADIIISKEGDRYNIDGKGQPIRHVSFIDAPGHEMLMATTLSGATLIDAAILVIAANEGIKPQTREHLMTLQAKRVERLIVVQNKIDLVTKEQAIKNYNEIKKFIGEKYRDAPIIPVSAQQMVNIEEIFKAIAEVPIPERDTQGSPLFVVARSFDINKPGTKPKDLHGTVLGGTLKRGTLKVGDDIEIMPGRSVTENNEKKYFPLRTRIIGLYKGSKKVDTLIPGGSMSLETELDMAIGKGDSLSGNLVSSPGSLPPATVSVSLRYTLFPQVFGVSSDIQVGKIDTKELVMLSINTSITGGTVESIKDGEMKVSLKVPTICFKGDNVGIARRIQGHWRLIGFGEII